MDELEAIKEVEQALKTAWFLGLSHPRVSIKALEALLARATRPHD